MVAKLRCKICELPHRNTSRYELWLERQVCRLCGNLLEYFSWNSNYLKDYWNELDSESFDKNIVQNTEYQDIIYSIDNGIHAIDWNKNKQIDFFKAVSEMEKLDWNFKNNYIGFKNKKANEILQFIRLDQNRWYADVPINSGGKWDGYYWTAYSDTETIVEMVKLFFEEMPWFGMLEWKMRRCAQKNGCCRRDV